MSSSFKPNNSENVDTKPLSDEMTSAAVKDLVSHKLEYIKVNRRFVDPPMGYHEPRYALFSFIPSQDDPKIFGTAKIRGAFFTAEEANKRAEEIVRNVDSEHSIFTTLIGTPFPLVNTGFSKDVEEINLDKLSEETNEKLKIDEKSIKLEQQKDEERAKKKREEIEAGEIEDDIKPEGIDQYILNRVKLAQFYDMQLKYKEKVSDMERRVDEVVGLLKQMYRENPEYETEYMEKYKESRRKAQIPETTDLDGFGKYMDLPIYFDDIDGYQSRKRQRPTSEETHQDEQQQQ